MSSFEHIVTRNLQCPICLDSLTNPKLLKCSHTFCKPCLSQIIHLHNAPTETPSKPTQVWQGLSEPVSKAIICPVCRKPTDLEDGDVSSLPTNVSLKSIVLDVRDSGQSCDICEEKTVAEKFCCDCGQNMCKPCHDTHNSWKPNRDHRVVDVEDIRQGKIVLERKVYCRDHRPGDMGHVCTDVCMTCKKFVCMRCRIFTHEKVGHTAEHTIEYEELFAKEVESLKEQAESKISLIKKHVEFVVKEQEKSARHVDAVKLEMKTARQEISQLLDTKKANLIEKCNAEGVRYRKEYKTKNVNVEILISRIVNADKLTEKIARIPLHYDKVKLRESLHGEIKTILTVENPKESELNDISDRAKTLEFEEDKRLKMLSLGNVSRRANLT